MVQKREHRDLSKSCNSGGEDNSVAEMGLSSKSQRTKPEMGNSYCHFDQTHLGFWPETLAAAIL